MTMPRAKILVVDPDNVWTNRLSDSLLADYDALVASDAGDAFVLLDAHAIELIVADINALNIDAAAYLDQLRQRYPQTVVIVCTRTPSFAQAVQATKQGAFDYMERSDHPDTLARLKRQIELALLERHTIPPTLVSGLDGIPGAGFYGIVSQYPRMQEIFEVIQTIADSYANVLIGGETGTGKELVARAIHETSVRRRGPFVTLDCSALARELLESELFGHEKGAFTGAIEQHIGRFERADRGTLLLDEVANLDLNTQAKLLRVLETRTFDRVGGKKPISVDVRIIAATNRRLPDCIVAGTFREDLYHRLNVVEIELPPLRERVGDVPLLVREFLRRIALQNDKDVSGFTEGALDALNRYQWPGNVRELGNVVLQAIVLARTAWIDVDDLPKRIIADTKLAPPATTLADKLGGPERQILLDALHQHGGNIKAAADALQISRTTFYAKLKKHGIDPEEQR